MDECISYMVKTCHLFYQLLTVHLFDQLITDHLCDQLKFDDDNKYNNNYVRATSHQGPCLTRRRLHSSTPPRRQLGVMSSSPLAPSSRTSAAMRSAPPGWGHWWRGRGQAIPPQLSAIVRPRQNEQPVQIVVEIYFGQQEIHSEGQGEFF